MECGGKVSEEAKSCPHCGAPKKRFMPKKKGDSGCLIIIVVFIIFVILSGSG